MIIQNNTKVVVCVEVYSETIVVVVVLLAQAAFIGVGAMVITNDKMRDHHFQMLSHRSFLRWKERHCVHFSFGLQTSKVRACPTMLCSLLEWWWFLICAPN